MRRSISRMAGCTSRQWLGDLDPRASVFDQALAVSIATMQQGHAALQRTPADAAVAASVCQTARRTVDLMQQGRLLVERAIVKKCWHAAMLDASGRIAALADTLPEELVRHAPEGEAVVKGILDRQIRAVLEDLQAAPSTWPADVFPAGWSIRMNLHNGKIWIGDNLPILRSFNSDSVDLIYTDPPFNTGRTRTGTGAVFSDMWTLSDVDVEWINLIKAKHAALYRVLQAAVTSSDKSYLVYMAARLLELRRVLKPAGSIYLHCDPTMSHYLKLVMDAVFRRCNFRNEIVWCYGSGGASKRHFSRKHDVILFYALGEGHIFNVDEVREPYSSPHKSMTPKVVGDKSYQKMHPDGRIPFDWWQIPILTNSAMERTGYPTQKPLALLDRIIKASSNSGDVVLDPFCGSGTACVSAELLNRQWIGIDISDKAGKILEYRLRDMWWNVFMIPNLVPQPVRLPAAWAEATLMVPDGPREGQRIILFEFQREILDAMGSDDVQEVDIMGSAQWGKTLCLLIFAMWTIAEDPCRVLWVLPNDLGAGGAKDFSRERLSPWIQKTPCVRDRVDGRRSAEGSNTANSKTFRGGSISLTGARSPSGIAARPIRRVLMDEIDRMPLAIGEKSAKSESGRSAGEGNPRAVAAKRTETFGRRRMVAQVSTPVNTGGASHAGFLGGDQRRFVVACPGCGREGILGWQGMDFDATTPIVAAV